MLLCDTVFQGTVLGPPLWNSFFGDIASEVPTTSQEVNLFADDLTGMTSVAQTTSNDILIKELEGMQQRAHRGGERNQIEFDPSKEYFKILHPSLHVGEDFRVLGTFFDCALTMMPGLEKLLSKIRPKIRALLRLRTMYNEPPMLNQYKIHSWSLKEYSGGALIMTAPCQLRRLDKVQRWFLHELGMTDTEAFTHHNFAPPSLRRSIGLLGFLHKRIIEECHPALREALPFCPGLQAMYHDKALDPFSDQVRYQGRLYQRSLYIYILMYNLLPQTLVDSPFVFVFQARLTHLAKEQARRDQESWRNSYQTCAAILRMFHLRLD